MKKEMIYLIEDNELFADVVAGVLSKEHDVRRFGNPLPVLELVDRGEVPNIVVTDINLPGMDGFSFIDALRSKGFARPIIATSGYMTSNSLIRAFELGVADFLEKPFSVDRLRVALRRAQRMNRLTELQPQLAQQTAHASRLAGEALNVLQYRALMVETECFGSGPGAPSFKEAQSTELYLSLVLEGQILRNRLESAEKALLALMETLDETLNAVLAPERGPASKPAERAEESETPSREPSSQ
jgi:CheY-like chemotaxis protein